MKEPFGLCPTNPKALELIQELHDELIDQFNSSKINIGMDETVDLGKGKSKQECQRIGKGEVFLKYVLNLLSGNDVLKIITAFIINSSYAVYSYNIYVLISTLYVATERYYTIEPQDIVYYQLITIY